MSAGLAAGVLWMALVSPRGPAAADLADIVSLMPGDSRASWPQELLTDRRVVHHWDERRVVGRCFGDLPELGTRGLIGLGGVMWDTYLVFGRDARWEQRPPTPLEVGSTIISASRRLKADVQAALR